MYTFNLHTSSAFRLAFITVFLIVHLAVGKLTFSQSTPPVLDTYIENLAEELATNQEDGNEIDIESFFIDLEELYRNPININSATSNDLERLLILSPFQIASLLDYRNKMREVVSVHELRYIYGFTDKTVELIAPFIRFEKANGPREGFSAKSALKYSKHELLLMTAYRNSTTKYPGSGIQQYVRYTGNFSRQVKVGILGDKDAGEVFGNGANKTGYDFYSAYVDVRPNAVVNQVVLGDYRVRLGQGLLIWNGYGTRKSVELPAMQNRRQGISGNSSRNEYNFLRGAAIQIQKKGVSVRSWASTKHLDGRFDSIGGQSVLKNINTSGYHRTTSEISSKNSLHEFNSGASIGYQSLHVGTNVNWVYSEYSDAFMPENKIYKSNDFAGQSSNGYSVDYRFLFQKVQLYGEMAYSNLKTAGLWGLNFMPKPQIITSVIYRDYEPGYFSPYSQALVESGSVGNEKGLFGGINWVSDWNLTFKAYYDFFTLPWFSFNANNASKGNDYQAVLVYSPSRSAIFTLRYKNKAKDRNYTSNRATKEILPFNRESLRLHAHYKTSERFSFNSRVEFSRSNYASNRDRFNGFLLFQDMNYRIGKSSRLILRYTRYIIEDYDARIYAYENDVLYAFSIPAYLGNGQKVYALYKQTVGKRLTLWLRYAFSGDLIDESTTGKHEIKSQLRFKF